MSKRLEMLDAMIAKGSTDPFHWYARALELRSLERLDEALDALSQVSEQFANYVPTYLMAAQVATDLERTDEARSFCTQGLTVAEAAGEAKAVQELQAHLDSLDP